MKKYFLFLSLFCLPAIGFAQTETAEEKSEPIQEKSEKSWQWELTPNLWMMGMSGEISINGNDADLEISLKDILKNLKMAFMLHAEVKHGKWGIMADILSAKLESEATFGAFTERNVDVVIKQFIIEFGGTYVFLEKDGFSMDALAGVRYFDLNVDVKTNNIDFQEQDLDFVDPFIGIRVSNFWNKFGVGGRFDIGGFGVGSDFSYKYNVFTAYQFSKLFVLELGYQGYKPDYTENNFNYNVASAGFILGGSFRF